MRIHPTANICDRGANTAGRFRTSGNRREPCLALDEKVVGLHPGVRSALAIAGDVADDEATIFGAKRLGSEASTLGRARREVLYEHIGLFQQPLQQRGVFWLLDVERQRLFAPVA